MQYRSWTITSSVACENRSADVERGETALVVACAHHSTVVRLSLLPLLLAFTQCPTDIGHRILASSLACTLLSRCRSWSSRISYGLCTSPIHFQVWTARIARVLQTMVRRYQVLPAPIAFGLHNYKPTSGFTCPHSLWPAKRLADVKRGFPISPLAYTQLWIDFGRDIPTSPLTYTKWSTSVKSGQPASPLACALQLVNLKNGIHLSFVACTHFLADVGHGLPTSSIACTHQFVDVRCVLPASFVVCTRVPTSDVAMPHFLCSVNFGQPL